MTGALTLDPVDPFEAAVIEMVATNRRKRNDYTPELTAGPFWNFQRTAAQTGLDPRQVVEVFIATKQARLQALTTSGREPANEAVEDTVLDRAVYAVIALALSGPADPMPTRPAPVRAHSRTRPATIAILAVAAPPQACTPGTAPEPTLEATKEGPPMNLPMKLGFADPPYYQCAVKFYGDHPDAAVYDTIDGHRALVARLAREFPDGWAMCLGSVDLIRLIPHLTDLLPEDVRVGAWCKSFASFKPNVNPAYTWEPVLFAGGRKGDRSRLTVKDHLVEPIALQKGLTGAKPPAFNRWILDLLGWLPGDELVDLFPGTGGMGDVVAEAERQVDLFTPVAVSADALFEGDAA